MTQTSSASTGLEDLLGVPDSAVTKDRLYRTLDQLLKGQNAIERDLEKQLGALFRLDYSLVLYDLTSTYFEGLAAENELAKRGYSRDHCSDCKQVVVARVVTKDGERTQTATLRTGLAHSWEPPEAFPENGCLAIVDVWRLSRRFQKMDVWRLSL
jgi:hypothetical protein